MGRRREEVRREEMRREERRMLRWEVDKQREGIAWSRRSAVSNYPVNGSIYQYTPHFVVYTLQTHTLAQTQNHIL